MGVWDLVGLKGQRVIESVRPFIREDMSFGEVFSSLQARAFRLWLSHLNASDRFPNLNLQNLRPGQKVCSSDSELNRGSRHY